MKELITYKQYGNLVNELVEKIREGIDVSKLKLIYTFMRGGSPIAVHLSHYLDLPVLTDETDYYFPAGGCDKILVVDDIADTGKTLDGFQFLFPTATLFYKPRSIVIPTFYSKEVPSNVWVVMPWERSDEEPNR